MVGQPLASHAYPARGVQPAHHAVLGAVAGEALVVGIVFGAAEIGAVQESHVREAEDVLAVGLVLVNVGVTQAEFQLGELHLVHLCCCEFADLPLFGPFQDDFGVVDGFGMSEVVVEHVFDEDEVGRVDFLSMGVVVM